jgi:hypothetical protein
MAALRAADGYRAQGVLSVMPEEADIQGLSGQQTGYWLSRLCHNVQFGFRSRKAKISTGGIH